MSHPTDGSQTQGAERHIPFPDAAHQPLDREAALQEILRLVEQWQVRPGELVDPAERQAALGNARRLVAFWQITDEELEGPEPPRPLRRPEYLYIHPKTGETWDGFGRQPAWLRRCLIDEGYRVDEVRKPYLAG